MAESKKIKLSENVTLSFLGNETINEVKLYKYDAKIKNVEKTKTIYLEKEASKYDKTILSDYIIRMVEEYDDQDTFFIVSNNNENNEDKDEVNESTGDGSNSSINDSNNSNDTYGDGGTSNSSSGFSENGGLENSSGTKEQGYSDETVELFQDVAKNAGEFDGSNLDAYKFDLNQFITFKSSIDKLKFISIGELPSAKSSLGQALAKASEGGCDEAVGMIETLIAEVDSKDIASAMDAQVRFYEEVDQIQLQQMQRDAQLNFEDTVASFDSTKYIVSKQEYKDGLKNTLYAAYESLADFMNAVQNYNYQVLSSAGRMAFAESSAGLEFYAMTDAEKEALANGEKGAIDFDKEVLAKLNLNSTEELLGIVGGFKTANELDAYLNSIGDNNVRLAVNEYVNKLIDSRWFNEFSSTEEGKQAYYEYFVNSSKENPNRSAMYDEYDANINTEYINNCIMSGQENLIISELASRPLMLRIINDETGIFGNNISYYTNIDDEEFITYCERYAQENDGNYPTGIRKVDGSLQQKTYTLLGEQFLYEMDYHADEWKKGYDPEKKKYTAFSKQAKYDAEVRSNRCEFIKNYENFDLKGDAERDWAVLNGQIEDKARLKKLKENGCLSFEDSNKIFDIIGASENQDLYNRICELGIDGLNEKDKSTLDTLLKNAGFNENQLWNFKLKYASNDNKNIANYIETQDQSLFDKVSELGYYKLSQEERNTIDEMLKQAGFSNYEITNFKTNANTFLGQKALQTTGASALIAGISFLKGVGKFAENCIDAGITMSNNNFWLLLKDENSSVFAETKKYKEMQQELYNEIMDTYKETGAYDRDYEAFKNSNSFEGDVIDYLVTKGYERDILSLKQTKIDELEEMKKLDPDGSKYFDKEIERVKSEREKLCQEAFLDAKIKELNLGDANASSQMSAAIKLGIRTGDFSKLYEYEKDQQMVDMANNQYSAMLDVAVDNVGDWVQGKIYNKEWYQQVEDASLIKKDNFLGVCVDQIGNMAIPILLSTTIPGVGDMLGASSASMRTLGAIAKVASSTALWTSAFGGAAEEAFNQGANYGDAINYSLLSATTELATEWMFSGIAGIGEGWYDDVLKVAYNKTLGKITSKVIENPKTRAIIEKLVTSGIGEGTEEVVTDLITPLWRSWTLEKELSYNQIRNRDVSFESLFETFSVAFVTSLFFSGMSIRGQHSKLSKNIENISRMAKNNPEFNEVLSNLSSELFAEIIENEGGLSQREIFSEVIGKFREQIMTDSKLKEAMDQANAELLKGIIKTDAANNITNMQEVIESIFDSKLLEQATIDDFATIVNVLNDLSKTSTNITAEQIYQELLDSDSKLFADNFANASKLNETTKGLIKSFTKNTFSYEFEDGSKIELSQSLLSEIAELDQTMKTNSFEINNGELVVKNEKKFRKVIEKAAKNKLTNLKYQNNLLKKEFRKLGKIDANVLENALYFMDQDSSVAHYTNDNVVLEYEGKSINVPVNLAVKIANEIGLDNYIKDGKIVFKSKKEMNAFANKVCELGSKAIDSINKRIDTTPNETFEDALSINNNKINMVANKSTLIVNKTVLEEGVVAYEVIIKNVSENDTGFRRKTIFTTEENLKNVFNENGLVQDIIDLMSQNDESSNIYLELTSKQIENIEKRIGHSQETTDKKTTEIEEKETITQKEQGKTTIQDEVETANQEIDEKANITESVVERSSDNASESTKVKVRARENVEADVRDSSIDVTESVVERNSDNASEPTKVKVRARENVEADVRDSSIDVTESVVERNDSSTREATRVKVRTRENTSTNIDEPAKASERVDAAQRNNATQTNADVIRNAASAATVVINAVANNANKASIVVDAPVYERKISNAETHGTQTIPNTQNDTNNIESTSNEEFSEVREVSKESVRETAERDGYIAYKDNEAAKLFEQNPEYKDWKHEVVDGEHRFYPPEKKQTSEVAQIIEQSNIEDIQTDFDSNDNMEIKNSNINTAIETPNSSKSSSSAVDSITIPNTVDLSQVHTSEELVDALFETNTLEANETRDKEFIAWKLQAIKDGTTMPDSYDERSGIMGGQPLSETYFDSSNERINAGKTHYLSAEEKGYRANFDYRVTIKNSSKLNYEDATAFTKTLFEELEKRGVGFAYKNHWESDAIILYVDENQLLDTVKVLEDLKDGTKYGQSVVNAINNFGLPISFGATISSNPYYGISMAHGEGRYGVVSKIKTSWGNVGEGATFNVYTQSVLFKNAYDNLLSKYNGNVDAITVDEMYDEILKLHREYMFGKGSTENIPLWMNRRNYIDYKKHKEAIAYKSSESVLTQTSENVAEATMRNSQTVLETNSDIEVIKVKNAKPSITQKFKRGFDPSLSYEGFDYVVKPKTSFEQALNEIIANNNGSNIVIEINNTTELTLDLIEQIPDNVKVRVTGDYNVDFMNAFKSAQQSGNGTLRNVTYTKEQLKSIMTEIIEFEKGIDPNWSDMEKARYAYDYLKNNIKYHDVKQIHELSSKEGMVGNNADRLARYDGLVSLIEKSSTCQGFAATYQELLTRMGIDARIVPGNLNGEGQHVYNVVKIDGKTFIVDSVREMLEANSPGKYTGSGFNVENIFEYRTKSSYQELIKESVLTQISENIDEIVKKGVYNNMSLEELSDFIKDNYSETQIPNNLKEFIHQIDEIRMDKAANEVEVEDIHIDEYVDGINEEQESAVEVLTKAKEDLKKLRGGAAGIVSKFLKANAVALTTIANPSLGIGSTITYNMVAQQILNGEFVANNRATEIMKETTLKILTWGYGKEQRMQIRNQIEYVEQVRAELLEQGIDLKVSRSKKIQNIISEKVKVVKENIKNVYGNVKAKFNSNIKTNETIKTRESVLTQISENIDEIVKKGVYNNMSLEELSDFIKDNYSETQIPNNLKEFIHQIDEIRMDKAANEVEVEDIHIDEYVDGINEEQESAVEVLTKAKEDLKKLRGGAAGIVSKFLKANAVALTTIANPSLGIGSTITYNMVAQQILNGEFVANNRATEIMKETTLKILTWGYGKEQRMQIRNQIEYVEQVRAELLEQGIDLKVSRSKKIQNIISEKVKVVKENIKNVYGNVKARFNNNVKTNGIVVNESSMSNEIVNNRNSRINELIDMSRNGTDIHYEYRTSSDTSLKEVQNEIVNMYENNSKVFVHDSGSWTYIHIGTDPNTTLDNAIKIYVPIDGTNANVVTKQVLDFLLENNIASRNIVGSHVKGDAFVLRIFDKTDAKRVINFINEQVKLNPLTGKEIPLTFKAGGVSVAMDGLTSYNQIATILIDNFAKNNLGTDINGFKEFVHALNEQIINGDVDLFETMFKEQIKNVEENPYADNEQLAKANIYEVIDIIDKALNNNMNANEFVDYISEYQNTSKVNDVIKRITGTEVINQNRVVKPNIVKTFITNINEKFSVVRNNIGEKFRIAKGKVNQFKVDLKEKLEIRHAENSHISADTSNVRIERIKLQMNSLMETYNGKVDFIREAVIKTLEYKNIPVTEENIRTNLEQVLNGNYNVITSREGLRQQVINASNEMNYCVNELSRLSLEISANEMGSVVMNAGDIKLDNIIKNANEMGSKVYRNYVEMHPEDRFDDVWHNIEGYFEQNSYDNLVVERWPNGNFLNFTIGKPKSSPLSNSIKMYIPINHANASYVVKTIIEQLAKNNIASDNKIARIARDDAFVLRIYDVNDAYRVANWINNNFNLEATGSELPLSYKFGKIRIAMDGRTSYNSIVTQLIQYYTKNNVQNLDLNGFKDFVRNLKRDVILNKNTDILETIFAGNTFENLKNRYIMEYKYDKNYAKANAYANLYEIIDILDANLNGNMSTMDFFRYLDEYTKPAKVGNIIATLSTDSINVDATISQTSFESVVTNNNQATIIDAAKLIANNNENLFAALRYKEMDGYQLQDLLVQVLGMKQEGSLTVSNEMQVLLDEFETNNGVITDEMLESSKQALLSIQNQSANNFELGLGSILENMGYERVMEKFGISEEAILNDLSQLYNDLFKTYEKFGLTEEQLNMIFAKIKFRNLDEMRRIYHKSDVDVIGGINIAGTSYVNLDSKMNTKYEIFLENVYHECTHAIGRITQNEINGYKIKGIINEYFTDLQAKKAGGFLKSEAYIPKLVNILEIIEKTLDPSCELFTKVYVEGNFSSLIDRLIEITGNENLANKLAKEIVETIETTHYNILNVMESNQVIMKNYYLQQAESFVEYLKQQIDSVNIENSDENIKQNTVSQEKIDNIEEIEISDEIVGSIEHVHKISIFDKIKEKITIVKNDIKNVYGNVRAKLQSVLKTKTNNGIAKSNNQDIEIIDESTIGKYKYKKGQIFGKKLPVPDDIIKHVYNKDLSLRYFLEYELYDKIPISCLTNEARRVVEEFGIEKLKQIDVEFLKLISNSFDSYHLDDYEYFDDKIYWMKYSASVEDINEKLYDSFKWLIHPSQLPDKVKQIYKDSLFYSPEELERIGHLGDDYEGVPRITEQEGPMIEDLIRGWDVYKDKDLNYFLNKLEWFRNKYREDASYKFKKFMNEYRTFVEELIQDRGLSSDQIYDVVTDTMTYFPFSPLNRIYKRDNLIFLGLNVEKVQWFADCFGLDNIIEFDNENGHILIKNDFEMLKLMYESERAKERMKNVMYDTWYYHGGSRGEFYDFLKETILDGNFSPDYREITGEFRDRLADLFISEQAPTELQDLFYSNSIATSQLLQEHPEYIQYLKNMKLEVIYKNYLVSINGSKTNLASVIEQTFGEEGLNLMIEYGKYIDAANQKILLYEMHRNGSSFTKEELLDELDSFILEGIGAGMTYDENMPSHFKEKYPTLFLKQGISENIKNKFYSRQFTFTIEDFTKNPELFELFENTSVICGLDQEYSWLIPLVNDFDNYNQLRFAQQYYRISNKRMGKVYKEYVKGHINDIDVTNIENIGEVLYRLATSNSSEINRLMEGLATRILNTPKPLETLDKVEDVFVRNNIPTVGKLYSCFETFCPDFRGFSFSEDSTISPMLKKSSLIQKKFITFSDLIKAAFGSNNRSVNSYLKNIEIGYKLYRRIKSEELSYDSLSEIEKKELVTFAKHLSTLYDNTLKGKSGNSEFISTGNIIEDISELSIKLSPNGTLDYNLADRIVKMFCGFSRIDTLEKAKSYISTKIETADARNRETASKKILLEEGDLIKGVIDGLKYLGNILQNGLTSKEYVGAGGTTDYTPLDIDVSMVKSIEGTIGDKINRSSAKPYGPIWFILKNDERFITTRDISGEIGTLRDTSKLELFYTGYTAEDHYGVRTGFASSEINYMVMEHYDPRVGLEIAMNGFYIPVVNFNGEVVFKPEDYDTLREKMAGLSYYDENNYEFSSNLITEDTNSIVPKLEQSNEEIHAKKAKIDAFLSKILGDYGLRMKTKIDGVLDTGSVELIDTGSTGRGTNKPSDGDFDFVMRLDKSILFDSEKLEDFTGWLNDSMVADDKIITDGGDFRFKGVQIDESLKVDLDISFVGKTDKITYSTDMALLDRLSTIKNIDQERYNYVVANIIFAKQFLKQAECYKPYRSDAEQGGLGGVGVENWILQNGGSFIDAAKEFLENSRLISYSDYLRDNPNRTFKSYLKATKSIKFEDFSKKYQIWDYGENHFAAKRQEADEQKKKKQKEKEYYFHDNFVKGNMSEAGYEKMVEALEKYISKINISNADATAHRQQFYGEAIETPTKSLSHYERLLDDLKIGKKSLFEKVDTAIYRDLSTMKSYIARSEVSNAEAKFLTEKTFLRLAEKYWGNEDAMKILSDIVPREGETLRETIASISNRVCELELSMYEENAAINEIHYVLDIPVKIIGNSSPILYLRLNEFEKAISRMPEKLKSILKTVDIKIYDTECFENATSSIDYDDSPKKRFVIYAGTMDNELRFYEHGASSLTGIPSIEYETITHELGHIIDNRLGNSEMRYTEMSDEWKRAMKADKLISNKDSVSDYGKTKVEEDFAESIKLYYRSAGFLKKNFPNRARLVEKCINNMNVHSPTMNAKTQNFYRSDTALNTKDVNNLISSKNIELSDIANLDSTKPISKIKDELFETIKSLDTPIDSEVIDRLTYLLDTYKTSNGSIYYKDVIGNDTYIITDNNVLFRLDNNENSILDVVDYLSNMSNSERNNMFLSFYKDTARIVNSYDSDNINRIHRVLSRLFSSDTYYEHKTKYIDLYSDNNYGSKQDIIPYYLKDSSLKERLVKLVKSIYPGMDDINANRLLRHMEVTPITDEGMCSYSVIANMIYEKYYGNSEAFLRDFSYEMSINSRLNSGELMADMYAYCNRGVLVNDNIVSTTNEEQVSLCDRKVSSMWNKLFNTDLINSFFKSKNINLEVSEEVLFDYYNIDGNTNPLSKNLFDGIISNIVKSLEQGKHVAIALSDFDIVVDGFEERISNNHVMSIVSVLDNGLLEVDSWGKKCYIDLKNITKSARQITISELSLNEK